MINHHTPQFLIYQTEDGQPRLAVRLGGDAEVCFQSLSGKT